MSYKAVEKDVIMKGNLKRIIKRMKVLVYEHLAIVAKKFSRFVYRQLFLAEWEIIDPPENFDHEIDLYYQWDKNCLPYWLERGVYSVQALKIFEKPIVIELCCGDGFNAKYFYSTSAFRVMACDFDKNIIKTAIRKNSCKNVIYKIADIRDGIEQIFRKEKGVKGGGYQYRMGRSNRAFYC